ncbi:hypothetical protein [Falsiruegeria mediterranea]|jgi:hypothetical protein|uniref:Uncharacterized protein n=1 Tax=Falsiruegeria mediterranea M17 TaxID=1200281 RepID=A0A2R8C957_9RHOB|nr:hypothetical protein [Falsiruegeria mediterranea]SPJ28970.1 hypothetical protein TRM7615_02480 [Falsiruegeria mediterranea M17]
MKVFLATACFGVLSCGAALAQDGVSSWGNSGDWDIMVDPDVGHGCFMQKSFDDGTVVQVGAVPDRQGGFFAALNAAWTEITDGQEGVLTFDFGDAKFAGDALGVIRHGVPGGYAFFDNPKFVDEFGKRNAVKVTGKSGQSIEVDLKGSQKAIAAVRACQDEQPKQEP